MRVAEEINAAIKAHAANDEMFNMKNKLFATLIAITAMIGCRSHCDKNCCKSENPNATLSCKLTTPELRERKATILQSLQKQVLEKEEIENGYAFRFNGSDKIIDELTEFVKSERQCCDFFSFQLSISGDTSSVWFEITGPNGAKEFIESELEL